MIKSVLIFDKPSSETLAALNDINLDTIFVGNAGATTDCIESLRSQLKNRTDLYLEVPVFTGADLVQKFPDALVVEGAGKEVKKELCFVCPTHPGVRAECLEKIKKALTLDIDGICLDYLSYPTKWEEPVPDILDTCYCDRCLKLFSEYIGEPIVGENLEEKVLLIDGSYYIEWLEFKTKQINSIVQEAKKLIQESGKRVKLGYFAVPWEEKEHGAAIRRILGQSHYELAAMVDFVSPMLYHKMCGKDVDWIAEKIKFFWQFAKPILPLIQTEPKIGEITTDEFKQALENSNLKGSIGTCIFFFEDLMKQPEKLVVVKEFFSK